jgi:hypothetical protein
MLQGAERPGSFHLWADIVERPIATKAVTPIQRREWREGRTGSIITNALEPSEAFRIRLFKQYGSTHDGMFPAAQFSGQASFPGRLVLNWIENNFAGKSNLALSRESFLSEAVRPNIIAVSYRRRGGVI